MPAYRKCCVSGCSSNDKNYTQLVFFSIPKVGTHFVNFKLIEDTETRRKEWLKVLRLPDDEVVLKKKFVCSLHFVSGSPCDLKETGNVDWVPSVSMGHPTADFNALPQAESTHSGESTTSAQSTDEEGASPLLLFVDCSSTNMTEKDHGGAPLNRTNLHERIEELIAMEKESLIEENRILEERLRISESQNAQLERELQASSETVARLQSDLDSMNIGKLIINNDTDCLLYTGFHYERLLIMFNFVNRNIPASPSQLPHYDQFVIMLVKLRLHLRYHDLAKRFRVSATTVSEYFHKWIGAMYVTFVPKFLFWSQDGRKSIPAFFRGPFEKCVSILDCLEIRLERPLVLKEGTSKSAKYLISITPQGRTNFVSPGYGGSCQDQFIVEDSGYLDRLKPGDLVIGPDGSSFIRGESSQLTALKVEESREVSKVRNHVERVIHFPKRFSILHGPIQDEMLYFDEEGVAFLDKVVAVCCALNNCMPLIVPQE